MPKGKGYSRRKPPYRKTDIKSMWSGNAGSMRPAQPSSASASFPITPGGQVPNYPRPSGSATVNLGGGSRPTSNRRVKPEVRFRRQSRRNALIAANDAKRAAKGNPTKARPGDYARRGGTGQTYAGLTLTPPRRKNRRTPDVPKPGYRI